MTASPNLRIGVARTRRDLRRFIHLPWQIYQSDPAWVPPLVREQWKVLDRNRHPFHRHAEVEYFLAWRGSRVAGRIAAILNPRYNEFHGERIGFFGFFESDEDPEAAAALLETAERWLSERGMDSIVGPMNFTTNDESHSPGILIEGFEDPPFILMAHGRPYYRRLLEWSGYQKAKDLLAYRIASNTPPARITKAVGRIEKGIAGLKIREVSLRRLAEDVEIVQEVYNHAWERNWGFVPLTEAEIAHLAEELKPILEPKYALIASVHGKPVGFSLTLPDFNQALRHVNGRLFPTGFLKLLWHARRINRARVFALGLRQEFRGTGIDAVFYLRTFEASQELGHTTGESSWILEDNWKMRRALEKVGAMAYKTYRVYVKDLSKRVGSSSTAERL
jgi:GNAT superfamily N-acetyltransferase